MASTTAMPPPLRASASNRVLRVVMNHLATAAAVGSTILVMAPLIAIFAYLLFMAPVRSISLSYPGAKTGGEVGGGMANSILGSGILLGDCQSDGRARRHCRRHLHRGVWPR